ncbi:MAG: hypothetical protein BWY11_01383 [Firmicutes bacterium ADurb.Bin182]|nr:MAG: hypothetical protein BWY11_01383 [Firmicutes bacterium ADurb.Bin182]
MKALTGIIGIMLFLAIAGCAAQRPVLIPERTAPAETAAVPSPVLTPPPQAEIEAEASGGTAAPQNIDRLGLEIRDENHFERYISYHDIAVYGQDGFFYMDGIIKNDYPDTLVCVLDICFYDGREEIAVARVHEGDGSSLLMLEPGENRIYADIKTDIPVTMLEFEFKTVGAPVAPLKEKS